MPKISIVLVIVFFTGFGFSLENITISGEKKMLTSFDRHLIIGKHRFYYPDKPKKDDRLHYKVAVILDKVMQILELEKRPVIKIVIVDDIRKQHFALYSRDRKINGFYSRKLNTIFLPKKADIRLTSHEIAHVALHANDVDLSDKVHEILARYVENRICR